MIQGGLPELIDLLTLEGPMDGSRSLSGGGPVFLGGHPQEGRFRVYGGQLVGQAVMAATRSLGTPLASLQAYFVRAAHVREPIEYRTRLLVADLREDVPNELRDEPSDDILSKERGDGLREGPPFPDSSQHPNPDYTTELTCVQVDAYQDSRLIFLMTARSAGTANAVPGMDHTSINPGVHSLGPGPEAAISREAGLSDMDPEFALRTGRDTTESSWANANNPFASHFRQNIWQASFCGPGHDVWFRTFAQPPADPAIHQALLAYYSDDTIMDNALFPHGWLTTALNLQTASLDHAMWFHREFDIAQWHLHTQDSPVAAGGRGMTRGLIHNQQGDLVASCAQEILMRGPVE